MRRESAESGERRAESGERRSKSGERRAESGERRAESGERRAESGERRAESGESSYGNSWNRNSPSGKTVSVKKTVRFVNINFYKKNV